MFMMPSMDNRSRVVVTQEQLDYLAEKAGVEIILKAKMVGDYDLIIGERENKEVRDGEW